MLQWSQWTWWTLGLVYPHETWDIALVTRLIANDLCNGKWVVDDHYGCVSSFARQKYICTQLSLVAISGVCVSLEDRQNMLWVNVTCKWKLKKSWRKHKNIQRNIKPHLLNVSESAREEKWGANTGRKKRKSRVRVVAHLHQVWISNIVLTGSVMFHE